MSHPLSFLVSLWRRFAPECVAAGLLVVAFAVSAALTRRHDPEFHGEWIDLKD